ncbi:hypothetical protein, partial [Mesorhizobium sp.]|uniref:hypothetical protein n=1 Tax=Mesorhizobium sp. TaxID=1871066 RepID=UPI0025EE065F
PRHYTGRNARQGNEGQRQCSSVAEAISFDFFELEADKPRNSLIWRQRPWPPTRTHSSGMILS